MHLAFFVPAVGEIVVYVDGMQGLIKCNELIQWLYQLASSKVGILGCVGVHVWRDCKKCEKCAVVYSKKDVQRK